MHCSGGGKQRVWCWLCLLLLEREKGVRCHCDSSTSGLFTLAPESTMPNEPCVANKACSLSVNSTWIGKMLGLEVKLLGNGSLLEPFLHRISKVVA